MVTVVFPQPGQHALVMAGGKYPLQHDVIPLIQAVARHVIDQPDIHRARTVALAQDRAPDQILADPGDATSAGRNQRLRYA
jgi:hypothetical protein